MDIIKTFENNNAGMHITIKGTPEEPLFRASDIAAIFEITNIRQNISDFDSLEKVVCLTYTPGGEQEVTFLTESGLYEIMFRSRKPIAKTFKKWVCEVIKEIRLNGKYEYEQHLKNQIENTVLSTIENTLLDTHQNSRGIYLAFTDKTKTIVKFGHGIIGDRIKIHKKEIGDEIYLQYVIETIYDRELEQLIKNKLKNRIISKIFPNRKAKCTELIKLEDDYSIENLYNDILRLKKTLKDDLIKSQKLIIDDLRQRLSKYEEISDNEEDNKIIIPNIEVDTNKPKKKMPLALTEKLKKKVYKFCIEPLQLVDEFDSIADAASAENISPVTLSRRINVGTNINGFIWSFSKENPAIYFSSKHVIVYKLDKDLNILQKYSSITEAARIENIELAQMKRYVINNTLVDNIVYSKVTNPVIKIPKPVNGKEVHKINTKTGEIIKVYKSGTEAALEANVLQSAISRRIKNKTVIDGILYTYG